MADTFPTPLFGFLEKEVDIEGQTLDGGTSLSGETDKVSADGGGRVFAEFSAGNAVDRETVLAWRAVVTGLEGGVTPMVVPFCDTRHQPYGGEHLVPHSDGSPFNDLGLYEGGGPVATASAAAALRATQLSLAIEFSQSLLAGEWFAIEHAGKGWRAYRIAKVVSQDDAAAVVRFRPPLREAVAEGTPVDFRSPRCLMVVDGRPSTATSFGRHSTPAIRFVESP